MDVEGAEYEVLLGAEKTLRRRHPRIIVEIQPENKDKVFRYLKNLGYKVIAKSGALNYAFDFEGKEHG